jgi:ATP-dependent protease ClpP protease subunit
MKEIRIEGEISSWTRYDVLWQLRQAKGQPVTVKVSSYGGDIAAAVAISHAIQDHGDVTVIHDSLNASAATWLPFGAKKIKMHEDCMLYVHCSSQEVFMWSQMNAEQLKELEMDIESDVRTLETMDKMIANKYAKRTGGKYTQEQMLALMNDHPWLTAQQCLDYGFVDEIISEPAVEGKKVSNALCKAWKNCAIPVPDGIEVEKTLLQKIAEKLGVISSPRGANLAAPDMVPTTIEETTLISDMKKDYVSVNALLNVEGIEQSAEGKLELTDEQVQVIEDKLKNLADMEAQLATANEAKTTAEDSLKAASDSLDALSDDIKAIDGIDNKCAKIKEMFDKVPAVQVPTPAGEQTDVYADIRKDPVNFYEQE